MFLTFFRPLFNSIDSMAANEKRAWMMM